MGRWTQIKGADTMRRARQARQLRKKGYSLKEIGKKIGRSASRVSEYLRGSAGENWNSGK